MSPAEATELTLIINSARIIIILELIAKTLAVVVPLSPDLIVDFISSTPNYANEKDSSIAEK